MTGGPGQYDPIMSRGPSKVLFSSEVATVGSWRCSPGDDEFPGGYMERPTVVFPRTSVGIRQQGEMPLVADPNIAVLYRGHQEYERSAIDPVGDRCEWFEFGPGIIHAATGRDALGSHRSLARNHVPASTRIYVTQRSVMRSLEGNADPLLVEELLLLLADLLVSASLGEGERGGSASQAHRDLVHDAKEYLSRHFASSVSLSAVGWEVGASSFHLARVFRAVTGETLHRYLTDLRLRAAMNLLDETEWGIADIAVQVGFASHSHLTNTFRRRLGFTPSMYRNEHASSRILTAAP